MSSRYGGRRAVNWLIWVVVAIIIIAVLFFLIPLFGGDDEPADAPDEGWNEVRSLVAHRAT